MSGVEPESSVQGVIGRVLNLLLHPDETWTAIEGEPATIEGLYRGWVLPLAAIAPVCRVISLLAFGGIPMIGIHYHPGFVSVIGDAIGTYALTLIAVYVLALLTDQLSLQFGGERSLTQAFKLMAYCGTAAWVSGVFLLLPSIGGLFTLLGSLYSLYLLYLGLPRLMRSNPNLTLNYFGLILLAAVVMAVIIGSLTHRVLHYGGPVWID